MPFLTRNCYYLRVSSSSIIPLYIYLDSQHVDWMSDRVLHQVVADLRPKIIPKLRAESDAHMGPGPVPANAKRGTVDVHRGDTYQFAYFLRETGPHSVLTKTRNFVLDTEPPLPASSSTTKQQMDRQKGNSSRKYQRRPSLSWTKRRKTRGSKTTERSEEDEEEDENYHPSDSDLFDDHDLEVDEDGDFEAEEDPHASTTKGTRSTTEVNAEVDVKMEEDEQRSHTTGKSSRVEGAGSSLEMGDDDEPKPKLTLELKYRAFSNFNRCLCVVVEPWVPQRSDARAPSLAPSAVTREASVAPTISESSESCDQRAKTPLFLPDLDDEPATRSPSRFRTLPPVPLFNDPPTGRDTDDMEEWGDSTALMQFSQMLNATGRVSGAGVEDEDEFDGTVLFADADEAKGL
ncbi:hypothetical protein BJV78DRAFT_477167 [Lactifluus subvellereus]|nr:hypothetical protein BJV78DRAFT_477167 [Lactifluus subvellereus]